MPYSPKGTGKHQKRKQQQGNQPQLGLMTDKQVRLCLSELFIDQLPFVALTINTATKWKAKEIHYEVRLLMVSSALDNSKTQ